LKAALKTVISALINTVGEKFDIKVLKTDQDIVTQTTINFINYSASDAVVQPIYEWFMSKDSSYLENVIQSGVTKYVFDQYVMNVPVKMREIGLICIVEFIGEYLARTSIYSDNSTRIVNTIGGYLNSTEEPSPVAATNTNSV
jgi:hypothetical protein